MSVRTWRLDERVEVMDDECLVEKWDSSYTARNGLPWIFSCVGKRRAGGDGGALDFDSATVESAECELQMILLG